MFATNRKHRKIVSLLISKGANKDQAGHEGWTPLMIAAQNGDSNTIKLLLESGASMHKTNRDGESAHFIAARNKHTKAVALFEAFGAPPLGFELPKGKI